MRRGWLSAGRLGGLRKSRSARHPVSNNPGAVEPGDAFSLPPPACPGGANSAPRGTGRSAGHPARYAVSTDRASSVITVTSERSHPKVMRQCAMLVITRRFTTSSNYVCYKSNYYINLIVKSNLLYNISNNVYIISSNLGRRATKRRTR